MTPTSSVKKRVHFAQQQQQKTTASSSSSSSSSSRSTTENGLCNDQQQEGILPSRRSKSVGVVMSSRAPLTRIQESSSSSLSAVVAVASRNKSSGSYFSSSSSSSSAASSSSTEIDENPKTPNATAAAGFRKEVNPTTHFSFSSTDAARFSLIGNTQADDDTSSNVPLFLSPIAACNNTAEKQKRRQRILPPQHHHHDRSPSLDFFTPKSKQDTDSSSRHSSSSSWSKQRVDDDDVEAKADTLSGKKPPLFYRDHSPLGTNRSLVLSPVALLETAAAAAAADIVHQKARQSSSPVDHSRGDNGNKQAPEEKQSTTATTGLEDAPTGQGESSTQKQVENRDDSGNVNSTGDEEETNDATNNRSQQNLSCTEQQQHHYHHPDDWFQQARQDELRVTSQAFIERLRGAAFRRKLNLTRSRDSLVAKERHQRETIAAAALLKMSHQNHQHESSVSENTSSSSTSFRARPVPANNKTNVVIHKAGAAGLPWNGKKKEPTIPVSPSLGTARRRPVAAVNAASIMMGSKQPGGRTSSLMAAAFKARSVPKTNGATGDMHGGLAGVPKVPKRPVTVPCSPLLGARRPRQAAHQRRRHSVVTTTSSSSRTSHDTEDQQQQKQQQEQHRPTPPPPLASDTYRRHSASNSCSSQTSSNLLGVDFLSPDFVVQTDLAVGGAAASASSITPRTCSFAQAYIPHSTIRAKKRAEFDARRKENEERRWHQERLEREEKVKLLHQELKEWAKKL
jgi:hypothetical protein